jgi:DNA-binding transcriptional ArsR family regulator
VLSRVWATRFGDAKLKAVMVQLADVAGHDGERVWPTVERIAAETELSESTVQRALRALERAGYLECLREGGRGRGRMYRIVVERLDRAEDRFRPLHVKRCQGDTLSDNEPESASDCEHLEGAAEKGCHPDTPSQRGVTVTGKGVTVTLKGVTVTPEPLEPLLTVKGRARARDPLPENLPKEWKEAALARLDGIDAEREWRSFRAWSQGRGQRWAEPDQGFLWWCERARGARPRYAEAPPAGPRERDAPLVLDGVPRDAAAEWRTVRAKLRAELGDATWKSWVKPLVLARAGGEEALLLAPTRFARDWVARNHAPAIAQAWGISVKVQAAKAPADASAEAPAKVEAA